ESATPVVPCGIRGGLFAADSSPTASHRHTAPPRPPDDVGGRARPYRSSSTPIWGRASSRPHRRTGSPRAFTPPDGLRKACARRRGDQRCMARGSGSIVVPVRTRGIVMVIALLTLPLAIPAARAEVAMEEDDRLVTRQGPVILEKAEDPKEHRWR